jgi:hypothetical protein
MRGEFMPKKIIDLFFLGLSMWSIFASPIPGFTANARMLPLNAVEVCGESIFEKSPLLSRSTDPPHPCEREKVAYFAARRSFFATIVMEIFGIIAVCGRDLSKMFTAIGFA